ncbi:hypothetical protein GCK72_019845 [Caenorhabditis remanei]|uniref:Uncharacterized protein n=1 Tax=Caenorhabditis remanei TaxID=31234 RepID=A0A6A5GFV0_CAERE|nr:hypothetical protein GCK72_019845 [Caenorhabditis remanei]KAF1753289.1 hypothetical protein GCK72_019845 [Caenorhabditis remanei]
MSSLHIYHMASHFSTSGFVATVVLNSTLIFLTIFHLRQIHKTYKTLLVIFAALCLIFSFIEMLVHPFYHSYNGGLINFNMVRWEGWSEDWITVLVASYSGVYVSIVSFFTVLFLFRYWTMMSSPRLETFKGWRILILVSWSVIFGIIGGGVVLYFGWIDSYSRDYMRDVMLEHYDLDVNHVSGYTVIAYDQNGNLRWNAFGFSFGIIFLMEIQFAIITSPTLTFYIPAVAILTVPFLNLEWSLPTGLIVCSFSIYPPIDSLILMLIVSDYRNAIKGLFKHPSNIFGTKTTVTVASHGVVFATRAMVKNAWVS